MITGFYAGLLGLMLIFLTVRIALRRRKYRVGIGDGGIPDLAQAIRVHGNFVETVPFLLIILGILELSLVASLYLHIFGGVIIISRLLHANGLTKSPLLSFGRKNGILLSLLLLFLGSIFLIIKYVSNLIT